MRPAVQEPIDSPYPIPALLISPIATSTKYLLIPLTYIYLYTIPAVHTYPFIPSTQCPPFWHGFEAHSAISAKEKIKHCTMLLSFSRLVVNILICSSFLWSYYLHSCRPSYNSRRNGMWSDHLNKFSNVETPTNRTCLLITWHKKVDFMDATTYLYTLVFLEYLVMVQWHTRMDTDRDILEGLRCMWSRYLR